MSAESTDAPRMLGRYRLLDQLATGGMAVVHLAIEHGDHGLERPLVIKQLQPKHDDESSQRGLLQEARLAARINHPNVVEIHELGTDGARPFIAMEYVPGVQLRELSRTLKKQEQPCPVGVAVGMLMQACAGAHAAHELMGPTGEPENLVHRDLSPHNLMVSGHGHVKVLDFGVAKAEFNPEKTETGVLKGKYAYMSPEQLEASELDRRSDVFTLATVLWELLAGRSLFAMQSAVRTIHSVLNGKIPALHDEREDVTESLSQVIAQALNRDIEERYQTADGFRRALQAASMEAGLDTTPDAIGEYVTHHMGELIAERQAWVDGRVRQGLNEEVGSEDTTLSSRPVDVGEGSLQGRTNTQATVLHAPSSGGAWRMVALIGMVTVGMFLVWRLTQPETEQPAISSLEDPSDELQAEAGEEPRELIGEPIRLALAPTMDTSILRDGWAPIEGYLEQELGRPVDLVIPSSYPETRTQLLANEVDFAVLPPVVYIQARAEAPELRLLLVAEHDHAKEYDGVLIVRTDSGVETLNDLQGKRICYVNTDSTTGYLLPRFFLEKNGLNPDTLFSQERLSGDHSKAIQDLSAGLCDVAATTSDFHHEAAVLGGSRAYLRLLMPTGRLPNDAICASPGVNEETVRDVTEALIRLNPERDLGQERVGQVEKISGFAPTEDARYDGLRETLGMDAP